MTGRLALVLAVAGAGIAPAPSPADTVAVSGPSARLTAATSPGEAPGTGDGQPTERESTEFADAEPKNELALFVGATRERGEDPNTSFGIDYVRVLSTHWAVGVIFDYAGDQLRETVFAAAVYWRPWHRWSLIAGPGIERHRRREDGGGIESYALFRVGVVREFELSERWRVAPTVNLDFVDGDRVWVYGVEFVRAF